MSQHIRAFVAGDIELDTTRHGIDEIIHVDDFSTLLVAIDLEQPDLAVLTSTVDGFDSAHQVASLRLTSPRTYVVLLVADERERDAALHGGAHLTAIEADADEVAVRLSTAVQQIRADVHRRIPDRRKIDRGGPPDGTPDRRGINWGPGQGLFNERPPAEMD